jgi:peptidase E
MLARQLAELEHLVEQAGIICLAGGHVAVLLNRLRLFGLERLLRTRPVIAWSAGAMAISERIVLFHDHPPQGAGNAEIFEAGLGLVRGTVFLPHAASRLALGDRDRVSLLARRLSPAACVTLDDGSLLHWHRGRLVARANSSRLKRTGGMTALDTTL